MILVGTKAVVAILKCASTTIWGMLGFEHKAEHTPASELPPGLELGAVIRDPVDRFLSAVAHSEMSLDDAVDDVLITGGQGFFLPQWVFVDRPARLWLLENITGLLQWLGDFRPPHHLHRSHHVYDREDVMSHPGFATLQGIWSHDYALRKWAAQNGGQVYGHLGAA